MKARQKARTAEVTSDLASEFESETKRRRIQKVLSSSEESIEESVLPSSPKRRIDNERVAESNTRNINEDQQASTSVEVKDNVLDSSIITEVYSFHPKESNSTHKDIQDYCCKGCQENANKLKTVIEQNHLLRSLATDIPLEVRQTREIGDMNKNGTHCDESLFLKYNLCFPLNSEEDVLKFDEILNVDSNFNGVVNELAKLGSTNNYNMVKRILTSLLTNEEAMKYSWLGRKGKKPFNNMKITQLIKVQLRWQTWPNQDKKRNCQFSHG
ncbi:uncharacterized protein [Leptinotarsa decemlineata]|uniref:uncharacterized protein n=1 Tax=Leptinotarsa decemlineata TaxID=7539 RepID=UPI003D3074F6